ncbi:Endopolyphosphatase [Tothia fuscella]|uniref:Endopolyphosphatase n=1 Tax=Tothia fuscella TaxID=1048955 RepID=A0A9P4NYY5_9PEZI|nr:Endopolyphosphatase [Tothia fuscella]
MRPKHTVSHSLLLALLSPLFVAAVPHPAVLPVTSVRPPGRKLTGKFLHITDLHPDPFYKTHSSTEDGLSCHRGKGPAGIYGAETSDCDSPLALIDQTFKWINDTIRDDIDFIVWTGDSARHDNDEMIPRSEKQVVDQNEMILDRFLSLFGKPDKYHDDDPTNDFTIPIIPSFGNNDILPHNIFTQGPNRWTNRFLKIWRQFIPEEQRHQFQRGGWFYVEVIPNKLAVFSLNTLYFFDSNSAVDGCALKSEPGFEQMEWLRIQLQILRDRGMKAMITGHIPPARVNSKTSWDETCWQKYTLWMQQYRDVIVGSLYGHMNIDHFMLQDFKDIKKHVRKGLALADTSSKNSTSEELSISAAGDYLVDLRDTFAKIPTFSDSSAVEESEVESESWISYLKSGFQGSRKRSKKKPKDPMSKIGGEYGERYSLSFVSSSLVPNYMPTLRVYSYNITGLEGHVVSESRSYGASALPTKPLLALNTAQQPLSLDYTNQDESVLEAEEIRRVQTQRLHAEKHRKPKTHKFKLPEPPSKSSPPGPAYSPQTFSLLGYTHYAANLTYINNDFDLHTNEEDVVEPERWKEGRHKGKVPKHPPRPKKFTFHVEYDTLDDKIFGLKDLTVRSYIKLAKRIAASKKGGKSSSLNLEEEDANLDFTGEQDAEDISDDELDAKKKKHHRGKKDKKHKKKKRHNKVWFTFIKRAFVGTMDPNDIKEVFGGKSIAEPIEADSGGSFEL